MEHDNREVHPQREMEVDIDPRQEYLALKDLENYYWNCINALWSKKAPENTVLIGLIKHQKRLNSTLNRIHNGMKRNNAAQQMPTALPAVPTIGIE